MKGQREKEPFGIEMKELDPYARSEAKQDAEKEPSEDPDLSSPPSAYQLPHSALARHRQTGPISRGVQRSIRCENCGLTTRYNEGAYTVNCSRCSTVIACQAVSTGTCVACRTSLVYPVQAAYISCPCGTVMINPLGMNSYLL